MGARAKNDVAYIVIAEEFPHGPRRSFARFHQPEVRLVIFRQTFLESEGCILILVP